MHLVMIDGVCVSVSVCVCLTVTVLFFQLHPQQCHMGLWADEKQIGYKNIIQSGNFIPDTSTRLSLDDIGLKINNKISWTTFVTICIPRSTGTSMNDNVVFHETNWSECDA